MFCAAIANAIKMPFIGYPDTMMVVVMLGGLVFGNIQYVRALFLSDLVMLSAPTAAAHMRCNVPSPPPFI